MFKKSFFTAITVVSLSASNSLAQSIVIPNIDEKPVASKQVSIINNDDQIPDLNVDKNLPLEEFRKQLQQKLQARLDWYNKQKDNLKTNISLDNKNQKDGYQIILAQGERVASYKNDAIQHLIYNSVKQKPELYLDLYQSEKLDRLLVKVDNSRLDLIPVVKLNHITQEYTGNMSSNDKYQFIEEIKVELTNALDKLKTKEDEELSALVQLKEHTQARIDKIDAIIDKIKDAGDISTDDFQQSLLDKLITEKREINVSLQSTVAKIATVKQKYADLMVKARNDAGVKITDKRRSRFNSCSDISRIIEIVDPTTTGK